ncbi:PspC domain-containing protein [Arthrobacter ruber]|uniref:PspC domain-containing protein n=1 Tax=Arthrobacter ruber TaxID=1258893 RepID=UPI001475D6DB|nr:PspC domain-containing protein [Arthrobacter ruber]
MTSAPNPGGPSWQQQPAAPTPTGQSTSSSFYRWVRGLDVTRTPDRWLGGVAGGVARRTGLDLALVRGLIVVLAVFGGIGVLLYGLAWALLPEPDGRIHLEQAHRGSWTSGLTGAAVLITIGLWGPNVPFRGDGGGFLWTMFWIGAVALLVYWIVNRSSGGRTRPGMPGFGGSPGSDGGPGSGPVPPAGPAPFGSAPFGSAPSGPAPSGPTPSGPAPSGPAPSGPAPSGPAPTGPGGSPSAGGPDSTGTGSTGTGSTGASAFAGSATSVGPTNLAPGAAPGDTASGDPTERRAAPSDDDDSGDGEREDPTGALEEVHRTVPLPYRPAAQTSPLRGYPQTYEPYRPYQGWSETSSYSGSGVVDTDVQPRPSRTVDKRPPRPSGPTTALLLGGAVIVAAVVLVLDYANILDAANPAVVALAAAAILLALGVIALGARGRTSGLVGLTAALAALGALVASFTVVGGDWIVAQQARTVPPSLQTASDGYSILVAETTIDLAELPSPTRDVVVPVNSLASDVTVIVPDDVPVEVRTRMALGSADAQGASTESDAAPQFRGEDGVLQLSDGELNPDATGAALVLDVRGALSEVTIVVSNGTDISPPDIRDPSPTPVPSPTGDTP